MSLSVTKTDFQFFIAQFTNFVSIVEPLDTIDMTGVLTKSFYSIPYDNGNQIVTIPLLSAANTCDNATFSYDVSKFESVLSAALTAWDDYFLNYHGDPAVTGIGSFMLQNGISVNSQASSYYYSLKKKHFPAGCVFKPNDTLHCTFTYSSSTKVWTKTFSTQTYSGNTYDIASVTGTSTKPQIISAKAKGILSDVIKLLVKVTYQTTGDDYVQVGFLQKTSGSSEYTNSLLSEVPVLKIKSLEILNPENDDLKKTEIPDSTQVLFSYSTSQEYDGSLNVANPSSTIVANGAVEKGDLDYVYVDDLDFYHRVTAIPDDNHFFTYWDSDISHNNNPTFTTDSYSHSPVFGEYNTVNVNFKLDGSPYSGTDINYSVSPASESPGNYSGSITIQASFDNSKYTLGTCTYTTEGENSGSWEIGTPIVLDPVEGAYTFSVVLETAATITFTTTPAESTLSGYSVEFKPDSYSSTGTHLLAPEDSVNISARLIGSLPSSIYVFKKWTGSLDYKAILTKTLTATNTFNAELINLGSSPLTTTMTVSLESSSGGTVLAKDLTNLNSSIEPTALVIAESYSVYIGTYISFSLSVSGYTGTVAWFLDDSVSAFSTTDTTQLDLPIITGTHTVRCVIT